MAITPTSTKSKQYQALGIDEIATDIETVFNKANDLQDQIDNLPQGGGGTTTVVNIPSAQILAMGSTPIELLPTPGANKYYDIDRIILEYTHVSTAYTCGSDFLYTDGSPFSSANISKQIITGAVNRVLFIGGHSPQDLDLIDESTVHGAYSILNSPITLRTNDDANPTLGDGTLRAIITYTLRTFGA